MGTVGKDLPPGDQPQPQRADSHTHFASLYLLPLGRLEQAIEQLQIAERNDPLAPEVHSWLGEALEDAGRDEEAINSCEKLSPEQTSRGRCIYGAKCAWVEPVRWPSS